MTTALQLTNVLKTLADPAARRDRKRTDTAIGFLENLLPENRILCYSL